MRILATLALTACCLLAPGQPAAPLRAAEPEGATGREDRPALVAPKTMVVAANPHAVAAGVEMLRAGGSAVDAAIAVQMVLGLVEPQSSGIGGGAFLLHWSQDAKRVRSYDGRETAPAAARASRFLGADGTPLAPRDAIVGGRPVGVPGLLRMLELAHREHGRLPWARLFEPAIRLAEGGFAVSPRLHRLLDRERDLGADAMARQLFYTADDHARPAGEHIVNAEYAATLRAIAAGGADAFYRGAIAEDLVRAVRNHANAGDLTLEDLAAYSALEREPVCGAYRDWRICGMGPPSSGGTGVLQLLGILERSPFAQAPPQSAQALHWFAEAGRLAYADRLRYVADPAFVPQPVAGLLEPAYLDARARLLGERSIGRAQAGAPRGATAMSDAAEYALAGTSHISIVDERGDAVAMTTTIEDGFGSRIMVRGFLLNNQLTDFAFVPEVGGRPVANRVEAGKRPRSSMSPTFVFDADGSLRIVIGSPGGTAIINYVAKALVAMLDWGMDAQAAAALPNFGSRNGPTEIERGSAYSALIPELRARGHDLNVLNLTSGLHVIERVPGGWRGGADPRREGVVRGD
ncbi:MAG: gamma-glutamyltransferase [Betaproteobacteria bacterium]|nr:MAG: gamma-glutamyltransferase [Betaproteobacteria bacterium]